MKASETGLMGKAALLEVKKSMLKSRIFRKCRIGLPFSAVLVHLNAVYLIIYKSENANK